MVGAYARSRMWLTGFLGFMILGLVGCAVKPEPLLESSYLKRVQEDLGAFQKGIPQPTRKVSLSEAMARAIQHNMDHNLKVMESALSLGQTRLANYQLLPKVTLQAGYNTRFNDSGSSSRSLLSGDTSLESSTSSQRAYGDADLAVTWNVLDFGVSYFRAKQQADRYLISEQRRRKVVHNIIQEVRQAYWRAAVAQELLPEIDQFLVDAGGALQDATRAGDSLLQPPLESLKYRMGLLETIYQITSLQRDLSVAKTQLAALMNLDLKEDFSLEVSEQGVEKIPSIPYDVALLEKMALFFRPELREEDYQGRIDLTETKMTLLQSLPGLSLDSGVHWSSNTYLFNQSWAEGGIQMAWNLINLVSSGTALDISETREKVGRMRRLSLGMAILTQVHVAVLRYQQTVAEFELVHNMSQTANEIQSHTKDQSMMLSGLEVTQTQARAIYRRLQLGLAHAEVQNAAGRLYLSIGQDPLPDKLESENLEALSATLEQALKRWHSGEVELGTMMAQGMPG